MQHHYELTFISPEKDFFISFLIFSLFFDKRKIIKQIYYEKYFSKRHFSQYYQRFIHKTTYFSQLFITFKNISHRFSKRFQILFYLFCRVFKLFFDKTVIVSMDCNETRSKKRVYYKAKEASDYYEVKPSQRCNQVILK